MRKIIIPILCFIGLSSCSNQQKSEQDSVSSVTTDNKNTDETVSSNKVWTEVFSFKGNGMKKSSTFKLEGNNSRIKYKFDGTDQGLFHVFVVPAGKDIMVDGGSPEVMIEKAEESESYIQKEKGSYYLNVNSVNGNWEIIIEEEK